MPDLLDDDALVDALRRYGTAVEAAARRVEPAAAVDPARAGVAAMLDYPVAPERRRAPRSPRGRPSAGPARRGRVVLVAAVVMVLALAAAVVLTRGSDESNPVVDTPTPTVTTLAAAEPFADGTVLMWLPDQGSPLYLGQRSDRPVPLEIGDPPQPGRGPIATLNTTAAVLVQGSLFLVAPGAQMIPTGIAGDRVLADREAGVFLVYGSGVLARYDPSIIDAAGNRPDQRSLPAWQLPRGWRLVNDGVGVDAFGGRVILERQEPNGGDVEFGVWTPDTDELRSIGVARVVIDVAHTADGPVVAWVDSTCADRQGCDLVLTNLDTLERRTVATPELGFIGGGGFSDDGSHLALFRSDHEPLNVDPSASLAIVDLKTLEVRDLPGTIVDLGEPVGVAAWTMDGTSVIYHGLGPTRVVDIETGEQRTLPWDITYSMATIP